MSSTEGERFQLLHEVFDNAEGDVSAVHHTHDPDDEDAVSPLFEAETDDSEEE